MSAGDAFDESLIQILSQGPDGKQVQVSLLSTFARDSGTTHFTASKFDRGGRSDLCCLVSIWAQRHQDECGLRS
uniref:hypothetical protein n=1 Tax=Paenarthrobacter nicotinovorans TaxID=29320 RepID=UPI0015F34A8B|nr:hypothetical protein [Paenarthrobacter nicotinovorans]